MASNLAARIEALEQVQEKVSRAPSPDLLASSFPQQRAFVLDDSPLQFAFCTRRAAKSYSAGLKAIWTARRIPKCSVLVLGLVRAEVKRIFWDPILRDIDDRCGLNLKFNETELSVRFPNGSKIYLLGADANENEKRKILGQKFPLVIIDEAQDFVTDLQQLVYHVLKPAVADYRGCICLLGTPGLIASGLFFEVTNGREAGWKGHEWTAFDNPFIAKQWGEEIEELKRNKPGVERTAWFRRNYLREWVVDEDRLVYRYAEGRNDYRELPQIRRGEWRRALGIDLGHKDASGFVVWAYHEHDQTLYGEEAFKQSGMDVTDVANKIRWFQSRYEFDHLIVDGANLQAVEEMRRRHNLPLICADKTGKPDFVELMNAEFGIGRIKLHPERCAGLIDEYKKLVWDPKAEKKGRKAEHPGCENHLADAGLYGWRHCYQYLSEPAPVEKSEDDRLEEEAEKRYLEAHQSAGFEVEGVGDSSKWEWFYR